MLSRLTIDVRMISHSGIGTYLQALCPRLTAAHPETSFVLLGDPERLAGFAWTRQPNVVIIPARPGIYSIGEQLGLARLVPADTDLFWVPHYNVPWSYRGPLVCTVHDTMPLALSDLLGGWHKRAFARLLFRNVRRKAVRVMTVSKFSAGEIERLAGVDREIIRVVLNGIDPAWFYRPDNPKRIHPRPYLLYVGNVKPHKNVRGALAAFSKIADRIPHDLVIVGKKDGFVTGEGSLEQECAWLSDRIVFTGFVSHEVLRTYMRQADTFVFPSYYEGFGLPPLEAMASGTPCLVSRAASLPEVCGKAPVYCNPEDPDDISEKLLGLLQDQQLRERCRRLGLAQARTFDWDRTAEATWLVMCEAVGVAVPARQEISSGPEGKVFPARR